VFYPSDRVLVAIMNDRRDFDIAQDEGWYRIPTKYAPQSVSEAAVLAFYFTRVFGDEKWAINWYAPVRGHELVHRRDLFPDEAGHPRADETYYKIQIGPLIELEHPIPSLRWRRITFIDTTWDRFTTAEEINDLYVSGADGLFVTLKEAGFHPEREYSVREGGVRYQVDVAIPCLNGTVAISTSDRLAPPYALHDSDVNTVRRAIQRLGGERPIRDDV
jgi:hypothetical protein